MIYFKNVSKYFNTRVGRHYIFDEVNQVIPIDKNIAILGPNGVGKSTLIQMIGGADMPNHGKIWSPKRISWPLALQGGLQGSLTARENVRFVARIFGYKYTKVMEDKVADFAEIGKFFDEPTKHYSSGMRARVSFSLIFSFPFDFDILLVDELSAVGDASFRKKSAAKLHEKYEKTKLIMVNHSIAEIKKFCQAGIVIKNQSIIYYERIDDAIDEYQKTYIK